MDLNSNKRKKEVENQFRSHFAISPKLVMNTALSCMWVAGVVLMEGQWTPHCPRLLPPSKNKRTGAALLQGKKKNSVSSQKIKPTQFLIRKWIPGILVNLETLQMKLGNVGEFGGDTRMKVVNVGEFGGDTRMMPDESCNTSIWNSSQATITICVRK